MRTRDLVGLVVAGAAALVGGALYAYRRALKGEPRLEHYRLRPGWRPQASADERGMWT